MYQNKKTVLAAVGATALTLQHSAMAALPTEAATAFTSISTMATDVIAAVWPIVALVTVGFIGIKLFKRGGSKV